MTGTETKPNGAILQTVSRAISLLRCFDGGEKVLSLAELTKIMGLNKVTVFRLASTLVAEGVLAFDKGASRYRVSYGLIALGRNLLDRNGIRDCAHLPMEKARTLTGETVCLSVREQWKQVVIHALPSPQPVRYVLEVASHGPVYNGAAGQCLIATMTDVDLEKMATETELSPTSENSVKSLRTLKSKLALILSDGYAVSLGERISEAAATAAPIYDSDGLIAASLSIVLPKSRAVGDHFLNCSRVARETARTISDELKNNHI